MDMKIETDDLIIRSFELTDEEDLCEYMLQRVNAEFESYPILRAKKQGRRLRPGLKAMNFLQSS